MRRPKRCRLATHPVLRRVVAEKLMADWSPQQIAGWLMATYPDNPSITSVTPGAAALDRESGDSRASRIALWPWLVLFAALARALDLLLRRVRIFRNCVSAVWS